MTNSESQEIKKNKQKKNTTIRERQKKTKNQTIGKTEKSRNKSSIADRPIDEQKGTATFHVALSIGLFSRLHWVKKVKKANV